MESLEIREAFEEMTDYNFRDNKSISAIYTSFNSNEHQRGFSIEQDNGKDRVFGMNDADKIKDFSLYLIEYGNIEYCRKLVNIGIEKATKIIHILNTAASKRNLPPVYTFKPKKYNSPETSKLNERNVSFIKYLLLKGYTTVRLSKIYNVSQSTISLIGLNLVWKYVTPVIIPVTKTKEYNHLPYLYSIEESNKLFGHIVWDNKPKCPHCGCNTFYLIGKEKTYRCGDHKCRKNFSSITGTPFENTKVKPNQWLCAMYLYNKSQLISSHSLARTLGVTQKTSWKVIQRLKIIYLTPIWQRFYVLNNQLLIN